MTLRQEIEALIEYYTESPIYYGVIVANRLTDILSRHSEPQSTAPSQRERIATACMAGMLADSLQSGRMAEYAKRAVTSADALIEELNKKTK